MNGSQSSPEVSTGDNIGVLTRIPIAWMQPRRYGYDSMMEKNLHVVALGVWCDRRRNELEPMTRAQIVHAERGSVTWCCAIRTGRIVATDEKTLDPAIAAGAQAIEIFTQAPN